MQSGNKTITKNTLFLYFRMMLTMVVTLFTSRVILQKLGVDDYGIYQAVGGIVGFLSFINGALSTGSSRFLTYALGEGDWEKLKKTFATTLNIHILIAVLVVIIAETVGLWFLHNQMLIAPERMGAAVYTYHLSILTALFTLTQVPYNASIIAHERMSIYAYMSIFEVSAKLGICYLLTIGTYDRLKLYATLLFLVQLSVMFFIAIIVRAILKRQDSLWALIKNLQRNRRIFWLEYVCQYINSVKQPRGSYLIEYVFLVFCGGGSCHIVTG